MIRIAICDDNEIIREELAGLTEAFMKKQNREYRIDKFKSGEEVCASFLDYSVLLLDIDMPGIDGIETAYRIQADNDLRKCKIIMVSALPERFKDSFKIGAFRFVTKPVEADELYEAIDSALLKIDSDKEVVIRGLSGDIIIKESDIKYVEVKRDYCEVYSKKEKGNVNASLIEFQKQLNPFRFFICHRSYMVNLEQVLRISGNRALLKTGELIPVSRRKMSQFKDALTAFRFEE